MLVAAFAPICAMIAVGCGSASADPAFRNYLVKISGPSGICTGVVIGRNRILTAAHCLTAGPQAYRVSTMDDDGSTAQRMIATARRHPAFSLADLRSDGPSRDVAVLDTDAPLPNCMKPARIASGPVPMKGEILGVGFAQRLSASAGDLRVMRLAVARGEGDRLMLSAIPGGGGQPCQGDSGGPIFRKAGGGYELVGIVSWGKRGCDGETAATVLSSVRDFIGG